MEERPGFRLFRSPRPAQDVPPKAPTTVAPEETGESPQQSNSPQEDLILTDIVEAESGVVGNGGGESRESVLAHITFPEPTEIEEGESRESALARMTFPEPTQGDPVRREYPEDAWVDGVGDHPPGFREPFTALEEVRHPEEEEPAQEHPTETPAHRQSNRRGRGGNGGHGGASHDAHEEGHGGAHDHKKSSIQAFGGFLGALFAAVIGTTAHYIKYMWNGARKMAGGGGGNESHGKEKKAKDPHHH